MKGDIVVDINGAELGDAAGIAAAYKKMRNSNEITIKVIRDGKPIELKYRVAPKGSPRYKMKNVLESEKIRRMLSM